MLDLKILDALRADRPSDIVRAATALRDAARALFDCRVAATANIASNAPMQSEDGGVLATEVFGWGKSDRWWQNPGLVFKSPITAAFRYETEPFWCNDQGFFSKGYNPHLEQIDLTDFEERAQSHACIAIPVHLPLGVVGAATFIPVDRSHRDLSKEFAAFGEVIGLYARIFISGYHRVMCRAGRPQVLSTLTRHEVECLRWAAIGKTDIEIGMILSRSHATVRFHIHNAAAKLNTVTRSQTLYKAAQLGYMGFNA